jgi:predicted lipid carrier protein YhbT
MLKLPLQPLASVLRTLPDRLHIEFFSRLFNHLLKGQWMAEQLVDLEGKCLSIVITDTHTELLFLIKGRRLEPCPPGSKAYDVRIKGRVEDFWKLATRREDPDTLFFNRELAIEGDTETGLYLKNMLDALEFDWEAHLQAVLGPGPGKRFAQLIRSTGIDKRLRKSTR